MSPTRGGYNHWSRCFVLLLGQLADVIDLELLAIAGLGSPVVGLVAGWALVGIPARQLNWKLCLRYYCAILILWLWVGLSVLLFGVSSGVTAFSACPSNLAFLVGPLIGLIVSTTPRKQVSRYPHGHCQTCGYNLTGNVSGRCPECGVHTNESPLRPELRSPQDVLWSSCGLAAALVFVFAPVQRENSRFLLLVWMVLMLACFLRAGALLVQLHKQNRTR